MPVPRPLRRVAPQSPVRTKSSTWARRPRLLVVGCGDIGQRLVRLAKGRMIVRALTSSPPRKTALRALGVTPLLGDLDQPRTLRRLAGVARYVAHLAPPGDACAGDRRTGALLAALRRTQWPRALVYASTSAVYGDLQGGVATETVAPRAGAVRAARRFDAERQVRAAGRTGLSGRILRVPGIYACDRADGTPEGRLRRGLPALRPEDDVYTNHIHADDLARACWLALWRGRSQRVYNVNDDSQLLMGDYYDLAADLYGLPRARRISRAQAEGELSALTLSFMQDSRRMDNRRMKRELRLRLRYPEVQQGLLAGWVGKGDAKVAP